MPDLVAAPEAFEALAAECSAAQSKRPTAAKNNVMDWTLGPIPQYITDRFKFGSLLPYPNIEALKAKAHELAKSCGERAGWYDMLLAIAGDIFHFPELRAELIELFHQTSKLAPKYDKHGSKVYPRERNEELLEEAITDAENRLASGRPIRTTASLLFDAANDNAGAANDNAGGANAKASEPNG